MLRGMSVVAPLVGGLMIGAAAAISLGFDGRIAGVSGAVEGLARRDGGFAPRAAFVAGLLIAGVIGMVIAPDAIGGRVAPLWMVAIAGALVGWGARTSNGCTSGHGVCGIGRLSPRSLIAVPTFMLTAGSAVAVAHALGVTP